MNVAIMKEIVREEVDTMFEDMIETGQGIGTSDITACMNACVLLLNMTVGSTLILAQVRERMHHLVIDAICGTCSREEEVMA